MKLRLVMQETLLPLVAVALSAVSACSSAGQRSSLPADFEFVSVSDEGLRAYRCGNETVDIIETYACVRPRIEETLGRQNMGDVPEVIDLSEISLVGLHPDQEIKLVSYLPTVHLDLHETISGEVGLAAVVEPCLEKVVHVYSLTAKDIVGVWKAERYLWWFADNGTGTIRTHDGAPVALEDPFVWTLQENNTLTLRSPEGERGWLIDDYFLSQGASLRRAEPVLTLRRLEDGRRIRLVWFAKPYSEIE